MHSVLCRPQKIIPRKLQERSSFSHDSTRSWNNRVAFERSGQDGSRGSPQICSTTCQRHSDEVPRPPWPSSGFKSRIREIFGEGAASDAGCSAILRRFSASDAGRSAILRRVAPVDPREPPPSPWWIGQILPRRPPLRPVGPTYIQWPGFTK